MNRNKINELCIMSLNILFFLIIIFKVLNLKNIELMIYTLSLPFVLSLVYFNFSNINKIMLLLCTITIFFSFFNMIVNQIITEPIISATYYKKIFMFTLTMLLLLVTNSLKIDIKKIKKNIFFTNTILIIVLTLLFLFRKNQMYTLNGMSYYSLTFRFNNPNLTGLFLLGVFIFEYIFFLEYKKNKIMKIILFLFSLIMLYFIYLTDSRTQFLSAIVLIFLSIFNKKKYIFKSKSVSIIAASFPIIFVLFYFQILNNQFILNLLGRISMFEQNLDTRYYIWTYAIQCFNNSPIFGAYNLIGTGQMHNTHLDTLATYGLLPFLTFILYLSTIIQGKGNTIKDHLFMYGFIAFIITGCGEGSLFTGSGGLYIYFGLVLLFAKNNVRNYI